MTHAESRQRRLAIVADASKGLTTTELADKYRLPPSAIYPLITSVRRDQKRVKEKAILAEIQTTQAADAVIAVKYGVPISHVKRIRLAAGVTRGHKPCGSASLRAIALRQNSGLSRMEIAVKLGCSYQLVQQVLQAARKAGIVFSKEGTK